MDESVRALIARFDYLRNSGVCSPTTRGLLDDAQALLVRPPAPLTKVELDAAMRSWNEWHVGTASDRMALAITAAREASRGVR